MRIQASRVRQRLRELGEEQQRQLQLLLGERGPLIRGSFATRGRVCGGANCHCTRGELHFSKYLAATDGEKVRQVHVPAKDEVEVARGVARYRQFAKVRRHLADLAKLQLDLTEQLGRSLLKPYPPDDPLPPPRRRGRPPKETSDSRG